MTTIDIQYQKRKNLELFKSLESIDSLFLSNTQNYIPIYNRFFLLNETNYNSVNLNNKWFIEGVKHKIKDKNNLFKCIIKNSKSGKTKEKNIFIKLAPLIDPFKFLVGKYNLNDEKLYKLPSLSSNENNCHSKLLDINNSAYIDSFFIYLISCLNDIYNFKHSLSYYGSYLSIKNNFKLNVFDDLEYLNNSEFFNKNKNILFKIDEYEHLIKNDDKPVLKPLKICDDIADNTFDISFSPIDDSMFENIFANNENKNLIRNQNDIHLKELSFELNDNIDSSESMTIKSHSTCSSRTSHTNSENETESDDDDNDDDYVDENKIYEGKENENDNVGCECDDASWEDINSDDDENTNEDFEEEINAVIPKFPVELIFMENCENTLDNLLMNKEILEDEWFSILMQIIMILITYQKVFSFTHNDLHTNNVMYIETSEKFITYRLNNKTYKVPTFGKIFKIIDFGRSIYKFKGKLFCSDSFKNGNDAAGQYNTEPYLDENKARLEPNFSFDLCRLACSMFDYVIEDLDELKNISKITDPLKKIIIEWCLDDNGINMLYKNNGDERYPDFKLYKMISRHVHNHIPIKQLERPEFRQFMVNDNSINIDIDSIPNLF